MKCNKQGFTLIELLVVVVIIGILAAVALPQYQLAVVKSRVSAMLPIMNAIIKADEAYYLENGRYAYQLEKLNIDIPATCTQLTTDNNGETTYVNPKYQCGKDFMVDFDGSRQVTVLQYCPGKNNSLSACSANRDFLIRFGYPHSTSYANRTECVFQSALGSKLCKNMFPTAE